MSFDAQVRNTKNNSYVHQKFCRDTFEEKGQRSLVSRSAILTIQGGDGQRRGPYLVMY
uniref:Uncharacterized protein n=1 Tax=Arundo donax TaxID=35708 RepID=A0A0A9BVN1_ARUDO